MSALQFFHPASIDEAISLLAASPMPVDSPTQRRIRGADHLVETFRTGRRRPAWVWAVREDEGPPLGVVAAFGSSAPDDEVLVLDHFGLPTDPGVAAALVAHATGDAVAGGAEEVGIFAPTDLPFDHPSLAALAGPLQAAGWRLLVERRHYEFEPDPALGLGLATELFLEQPVAVDDPRLVACHREVMRDTLDAHDAALVARLGFEEACRESLAYLLDADPVECIRLATDRTGSLVGLVSGRLLPTGRAFVLFVGVCRDHRGHGYGRELLAWQTGELVASGATVLIADTDNTNLPMARAFAEVGWPQTETRIDLVR
ncbi:MAG: GNAT family N-acetyltransferase [Nocardioides sp.]